MVLTLYVLGGWWLCILSTRGYSK